MHAQPQDLLASCLLHKICSSVLAAHSETAAEVMLGRGSRRLLPYRQMLQACHVQATYLESASPKATQKAVGTVELCTSVSHWTLHRWLEAP